MKRLYLTLVFVLFALPAYAADMVACGQQASGHLVYTVPGETCHVICAAMGTGAGGTVTTCPILRIPNGTPSFNQMTFLISSGASNCATGPIEIRWHPAGVVASPNVPQTAATLTGLTGADVSSSTINSAVGPFFDATFTIADTDCNANGGVDIVVKTKQVKP